MARKILYLDTTPGLNFAFMLQARKQGVLFETQTRSLEGTWVESLLHVSLIATWLGAFSSTTLLAVSTTLLLLIGVMYFYRTGELRLLPSLPLFLPFLALAAAIIVSIILASPYEFLKPLGKLRYYLVYFVAMLYFLRFPERRAQMGKLSSWLAILFGALAILEFVGIFSPIYAMGVLEPKVIPQSSGRLFHARGLLFHHVPFGSNCLLLFHLCLGLALNQTQEKQRRWLFMASGAAAVAVILSFSRGAWLGLLGSCLVIALAHSRRTFVRAAGVGAVIVALALTISPAFRSRVFDLRPEANGDRLVLWQISWEMFKRSPVFGEGYHSFAARRDSILQGKIPHDHFPVETHSMYFDMLGGAGIVGFSLFLILLGTGLVRLWEAHARSSPRTEARGFLLAGLGGLASFVIVGVFDKQFYMTYTLVGILVLLALTLSFAVERRAEARTTL